MEVTVMGYIEEIRAKVGNMPIILNSSGAIIRNSSGHILLVHRNDTDNWGIPGGYMEVGETFEDTINREIREELGIKVINVSFLEILSGPEYYHEYPNGDMVYSVIALFEAQIVDGKINIDNQEINNAKFFSLESIPKQITKVTRKILGNV
jgi:mutator protein MutT